MKNKILFIDPREAIAKPIADWFKRCGYPATVILGAWELVDGKLIACGIDGSEVALTLSEYCLALLDPRPGFAIVLSNPKLGKSPTPYVKIMIDLVDAGVACQMLCFEHLATANDPHSFNWEKFGYFMQKRLPIVYAKARARQARFPFWLVYWLLWKLQN
jgi:hypothetical protein